MIGSCSKGLKTCGKPLRASALEKSENQFGASPGSASWTPLSTLDVRTCLETVGSDVPASADPISQATSSIEITLTTEPPAASRTLAGRLSMWPRSFQPKCVVTACPTAASTITTTTATTEAVVPGLRWLSSSGSSWTATSPPPRKPSTDRTPTTNPCR